MMLNSKVVLQILSLLIPSPTRSGIKLKKVGTLKHYYILSLIQSLIAKQSQEIVMLLIVCKEASLKDHSWC